MLSKKADDAQPSDITPTDASEKIDDQPPKIIKKKPTGFRNDAEAEPLYQGTSKDSREALLLEVAEHYNLVMDFLTGHDAATRDFLSYVILQMIPQLKSLDELSAILSYLESNKHNLIQSSSSSH